MSQVLAFIVGASVALVAQALGHSLTVRRDRRTDLVRALDKAVSAYAEGERVLDDLIDALDVAVGDLAFTGYFLGRPYVVEALGQAERTRVEMRAALFSIRVRLESAESPMFQALNGTFKEWEIGFLKCKEIVRTDDISNEPLRDARGHASTFRGEFYDVALERAADAVGRLKA